MNACLVGAAVVGATTTIGARRAASASSSSSLRRYRRATTLFCGACVAGTTVARTALALAASGRPHRRVTAARPFGRPWTRGGAVWCADRAVGTAPASPARPDDDDERVVALTASCRGTDGVSSDLRAAVFGDVAYVSTSDSDAAGKHRVVFVLGGPGAGKGTQCARIVDDHRCVHLSVGELLRNAAVDESPHAELIEECLAAGRIVPVEISLALLRDAMDRAFSNSDVGAPVFLVDGFPRNFDNLEGWARTMSRHASVLGALVFDCPAEELERRILSRGETSGRSDDNAAAARRRFETFRRETMPVLRVLEALAVEDDGASRVARVAGERPLEEVWRSTREEMNAFVVGDVLSANDRLLRAVEGRDVDGYLACVDERMLTERDTDSSAAAADAPSPTLETAFRETEVVSGGDVGPEPQTNEITNVSVRFHDGTSSTVSYDRAIKLPNGEVLSRMRESRVWNHGRKGWVNVYFERKELP